MKWNWLRNKKTWLILVIVGVAISLIRVLPLNDWLTSIKDWLLTFGLWATPMFVGVYVLAAIAGLPNVILILAAGTLFGLVQGIIDASIADAVSVGACYLIGRTVARKQIKKIVAKEARFSQLDKALAEKAWKIILLTRLSPVLPSNILNYGFSLTQVSFWPYLFFSWLGMLPVIIIYVYVGAFGATLADVNQNPTNLALQVVGLIITSVGVVYVTRRAKAILSQTEASSEKRND